MRPRTIAIVLVLVVTLAILLFMPISTATNQECTTQAAPKSGIFIFCREVTTPVFGLLGCGVVYSRHLLAIGPGWNESSYAFIGWACKQDIGVSSY